MTAAWAAKEVFLFNYNGAITIWSIPKAGSCGAKDRNDRNIARRCNMHWRAVVTNNNTAAIHERHECLKVCPPGEIDALSSGLFIHRLRNWRVVRPAANQHFAVVLL
jgi:hypothetical protein